MGQTATINFLVKSMGHLGGVIEYLHTQTPNVSSRNI